MITSVLLVLIILAQNSKGGGLSSQFGGSGASNIIGVKKTTDLLEKLTWGFGIAIVIMSVAVNILADKRQALNANSPNLDKAQQEQQTIPALDLINPSQDTPDDGANDLDGSDDTDGLDDLTK